MLQLFLLEDCYFFVFILFCVFFFPPSGFILLFIFDSFYLVFNPHSFNDFNEFEKVNIRSLIERDAVTQRSLIAS